MSNLARGLDLELAVCSALGLDPSTISKLVISLSVDRLPQVEVTRYLDPTSEAVLTEVFKLTHFEVDQPTPEEPA